MPEELTTELQALRAELKRLRAENKRLGYMEALRDILKAEAEDLQSALNAERLRYVTLKEAYENIELDMSLMEEQIRELGNVEPGGTDFGP